MITFQSFLPSLPTWLSNLLVGAVVFFLFYLLACFIKLLFLRIVKRSNPSKAYVFAWLAQAAKNILIVIGLIIATAVMGINVTALVTSLGLTGVTIGLVMKDLLANTLAGALVLIYPPFHLGDFIKVSGVEGKVLTINMRHTALINLGEKILIPNIVLLTQPIVIIEAREEQIDVV